MAETSVTLIDVKFVASPKDVKAGDKLFHRDAGYYGVVEGLSEGRLVVSFKGSQNRAFTGQYDETWFSQHLDVLEVVQNEDFQSG